MGGIRIRSIFKHGVGDHDLRSKDIRFCGKYLIHNGRLMDGLYLDGA
jgi:hypothetical protein